MRSGRWRRPAVLSVPCCAAQKLRRAGDSPCRSAAQMTTDERLAADFAGTGLTIGPHPMAYHRAALQQEGILVGHRSCCTAPTDRRVRIAGCVIARQRPGTAKGFVFLSLEDETGIANVIITPDVYEQFKQVVVYEKFLLIEGELQNQENVVSVKAREIARSPSARPRFAHTIFTEASPLLLMILPRAPVPRYRTSSFSSLPGRPWDSLAARMPARERPATEPELILQPAALNLAASGGELCPVVVHLLLRVAAHNKRDGFSEFVLGPPLSAVNFWPSSSKEMRERLLPSGTEGFSGGRAAR